jgi:membrane protease subunit HflK
MYYETMEAVLGETDKVIVDTPGANTYLPLPGFPPHRAANQQQAQQGGGQ